MIDFRYVKNKLKIFQCIVVMFLIRPFRKTFKAILLRNLYGLSFESRRNKLYFESGRRNETEASNRRLGRAIRSRFGTIH